MTVESATYVADLDPTYPAGTDAKSEGDDHIRLIKSVLQSTFGAPGAAAYTLAGITDYASGSGTYTPTTGVRALYVECYGAGGGGGGVDGQGTGTAAISGGGGGGAYAAKLITTLAASYTYAVGAGGAGGSAGANNGSDGGNTTFAGGSVSISAGGGGGGQGETAQINCASASGAAGAATGGDVNISGGTVRYNGVVNGAFTQISPAGEAAGPFGGRGAAWTALGTGADGNAPGGGGGNVVVNGTTSSNYAGGDGAAGLIRIWEYY